MSDIQRTVIRGLISGLEFVGERIEDAVMALDDLLFELEESSNPRGIRGPTPNIVIHDELNEFRHLGVDPNGPINPWTGARSRSAAFVSPFGSEEAFGRFLDSILPSEAAE